MKRVLVAIGTRPDLIKLAPVVLALRGAGAFFDVRVVFTGQHRELLDQMAGAFAITADMTLDVMHERQGLAELTARLLVGMDRAIEVLSPEIVLAQGDTTTVLAAGLSTYYRGVPFGHVEAGLRTGDLTRPFPEEGNRRMVAGITRWHFAPTDGARANLVREGIDPTSIHVVGNTVIDALDAVAGRAGDTFDTGGRQLLVMTLHRRESFGAPLVGILRAVRRVLEARPDVVLVYPLHPNPSVRAPSIEILGDLPNAELIEPLDYVPFIRLLERAALVLTDSGGVQEEAPALGVPVLVLRDTTERPEGVAAGVARLVGTAPNRLEAELRLGLSGDAQPRQRVRLYGDGHASARIAAVLAD